MDLVLNSKFSSKTTAETQLLHSTVRELAKEIDNVLTIAYEEIYDDSDVRVELCTQPLSPATELLAMHEAGVLPRALATERALHSIGASREQIRAALERVRAEEAQLGSR